MTEGKYGVSGTSGTSGWSGKWICPECHSNKGIWNRDSSVECVNCHWSGTLDELPKSEEEWINSNRYKKLKIIFE